MSITECRTLDLYAIKVGKPEIKMGQVLRGEGLSWTQAGERNLSETPAF